MRKAITYALAVAALLIAGAGELRAQHYFGIRAGYGSGSARLYPELDFENGSIWGLYSGGVSWKFYTSEAYVGGVEVDLIFMQQGYKTITKSFVTGDNETGYERYVNTVMVPVFWQPHVYMFKQRLRVFLNAGVTLSYVVSSSEKDINYMSNTSEKRDYNMRLTRDNRFGYGLCGGGGVSWSAGRLEVFAEARYYIGYSDILKNRNKNETNDHLRSPLDGMQFSMGMFWRVGKDGIKSAQGRPVSEDAVRSLMQSQPQPEAGDIEVITETGDDQPQEVIIEEETAGPEAGGQTDDGAQNGKEKKSRKERRRDNKKTELWKVRGN